MRTVPDDTSDSEFQSKFFPGEGRKIGFDLIPVLRKNLEENTN